MTITGNSMEMTSQEMPALEAIMDMENDETQELDEDSEM